ncbi:glycosyltransferase family 4 protein [Aliagarivorans marinus]|uniref:glycosyltransferase family 4 protein n=1 Tax=Aliagarivorans marinus TaxID=561965 RepID=UPI0012F819ED|nr:glycosyltransferase family 4 protein [Aliagarivorans marinus]
MSSALTAFVGGLERHYDFEYTATQKDGERFFQSWLAGVIYMLKQGKGHYQDSACWFHMGPWLSMLRKFSLALIAKCFRAKCIAHFHSPTLDQYLDSKLGTLFVRLILVPFDQVVVLTPWWKTRLLEVIPHLSVNIVANPIGSELEKIATQRLSAPSRQAPVSCIKVLSMARLVEGKGIELVISSFSLLPKQYELTIAGDGPLKNQLIKQVHDLNLVDRVTFTGWLGNDEKKSILEDSDIFCLPSEYDSFGMVFIEAMSFGLPVIAKGWGPIPDVVTHDVGIAVPADCSSEQLARSLQDIVLNYSAYQQKGPKRVINHYAIENIRHKVEQVLHKD